MAEHGADLDIAEPNPPSVSMAEHKRALTAVLHGSGFEASPYERLLVAVALTAGPERSRAFGKDEVDATGVLMGELSASRASVRRGLRTLRKAGCLTGADGRVVLSHTAKICGVVDDDPLKLDEVCVRAMSRLVASEYPDGLDVGKTAFRQLTGRAPIDEASEPLAISEVQRVAARPPSQPLPVGRLSEALREAGLDPMPGYRRKVIEFVVRRIQVAPATTAELSAEVTDSIPGADHILRALLLSGRLMTADGAPAALFSEQVVSCEGTVDEIDAACLGVYRMAASKRAPDLLDHTRFEQAFEVVTTRPRPPSAREVIDALAALALFPEPNVRPTVVKQILVVIRDRPTMRVRDLVDRVCDITPATQDQVRKVILSLTRAGILDVAADNEPLPRPVTAKLSQTADVEEELLSFYMRQLADQHPWGAAHAFRQRVMEAIGMTPTAAKRKSGSATINAMKPIYDTHERIALISHVRDVFATASPEGLALRDITKRLAAARGTSNTSVQPYVSALVRSGLLVGVAESEVDGRPTRFSGVVPDDAAVSAALVESWVQGASLHPAIDVDEFRSRFT